MMLLQRSSAPLSQTRPQRSHRAAHRTPLQHPLLSSLSPQTQQHQHQQHSIVCAGLASPDSPPQEQEQHKPQTPLLPALPTPASPTPSPSPQPAALASALALLVLAQAGPADALDASQAHTLQDVLRPTFALFTALFIVRIPMTWYPNIEERKLPWVLATAPTEPLLLVTRKVVGLVGGVDVSPIIWVALLSFLNEVLIGPQGLLVLIERQGGL